ncbi:transcription factor bHLH57-like isoform X2 [Macadamia integrifolia]|uniref:transcription factor bHLH57-like isoform X2 n=1 Tax=Macadamia integrifolia TaxID=60698 RepID=UPI001C529952|nr:transcription factor bHLH57-like isoform X2 [Macadamia integrifolia]
MGMGLWFFPLTILFLQYFLEPAGGAFGFTHDAFMNPEDKLRFEEEGQPFSTLSQNYLEEKMSFLETLRAVESSSSFIDPNFELLLRMQQQQQQNQKKPKMEWGIQALELESCITNDAAEAYSPIKSEGKGSHHPQSSTCPELEVVSSACNGEAKSPENRRGRNRSSRAKGQSPESKKAGSAGNSRERRNRKRARLSKHKEEVESRRMTHIAVERNRRRQMNDLLNALRSLIPTSFVRRGDQASIIGGAVDFVRELEQLLQSLEAQKRMRNSGGDGHHSEESVIEPSNGFFASSGVVEHNVDVGANLQVNEYMKEEGKRGDNIKEEEEEEMKDENKKAATVDIEVLVIEKRHVKLKIVSPRRRAGELVRAIGALEDLRLTILHLDITSSELSSVLYSFNLKMEDDCKLGSAAEIATTVYQTFSLINGS